MSREGWALGDRGYSCKNDVCLLTVCACPCSPRHQKPSMELLMTTTSSQGGCLWKTCEQWRSKSLAKPRRRLDRSFRSSWQESGRTCYRNKRNNDYDG